MIANSKKETPVFFELGKVSVTRGVFDVTTAAQRQACLDRHIQCDFGEADNEQEEINRAAIDSGQQSVMSAYRIDPARPAGFENVIWIITRFEPAITTMMLPYEH